MSDTLRIGELAKQAGVTTRTIRYYETLGLLQPAERDGGFRYYQDDALKRLHKIDALKSLGLSLEEIATVIDLYFEDPTGISAKRRVLALLEGHLREAEGKISSLEQFCDDLKSNIGRMEEFIKTAPKK